MFIVGLTGGIATGKSLVSSMAKDFEIPVVDADQIAHEVQQQGKPVYRKMLTAFGPVILKSNGDIDRCKVGDIIFNNAEKRKELNGIIHPYVYSEIRKQVLSYIIQGTQFIILDLPLLFETGIAVDFMYKTVVVTCEENIQMDRLMSRNGFSRAEARRRIEAQMPLHEKISQASFVIENSGSIENTRKQFESIVRILRSSNHHIRNRMLYGGVTFLLLIALLFALYYLGNLLVNYLLNI